MYTSKRNHKQRKYRSKRKININKQYQMIGSSVLSNKCKQQIMNIFNNHITHNHNNILALKSLINELSKIHPISLIKCIDTHFNKKDILNKFNNDKCFETFLNILQNDYNVFKDKIIKDYSYNQAPELTLDELISIINKVIPKNKLYGGKPHDNEEPNVCSICLHALENGSDILSLDPCGHQFHPYCIRLWFTNSPRQTCPYCRQIAEPLTQLSEQQNQEFLVYQQDFPIQSTDHVTLLNRLRIFINRNFIPGLLGLSMYYSQYMRNMAAEVVNDMAQYNGEYTIPSSESTLMMSIMFLLFLYNMLINI